jgi:hypothetical protein
MRVRCREGDLHADHCTKRARLIGDLGDASVRVLSQLTRLLRSRGIAFLQRMSLLPALFNRSGFACRRVRLQSYIHRAWHVAGTGEVDPFQTFRGREDTKRMRMELQRNVLPS